MSCCSGACQSTSKIWAVISDGSQMYVFKYRNAEKAFTPAKSCQRACTSEPGRQEQDGAHNNHKCCGACRQRAVLAQAAINDPASDYPLVGGSETVLRHVPTIADKLMQAFNEEAFDHLVIVAPRETTRALQASLSEELQSHMLANMPLGYVYDNSSARFVFPCEGEADFAPLAANDTPTLVPLLRSAIDIAHGALGPKKAKLVRKTEVHAKRKPAVLV